jgi:putative DNA primase/helicase
MEHYNEMLSAAHEFGLDTDHLVCEQKWQRVRTVSKPKCKNGSYYIFPGEKAMIMWDWQHNITKTWRPQGYSFTRQDKIELNLVREAEKAKRIKNQQKAIRRCNSIWRQSTSPNNHSYISRKKIRPYIGRVDRFDNFLIPICSLDGMLMSLQFISPEGNKRFKSDAPLKGHAALIGDFHNASVVLICEGYATGCSLHEASGMPVVVAFNAGNLAIVSKAIAKSHPKNRLVICADNDHQTQKKTGVNVGLDKARLVSEQLNATLIWPQFQPDNHGSDFNDVHCQFGLDALLKMLSPVLSGGQYNEL